MLVLLCVVQSDVVWYGIQCLVMLLQAEGSAAIICTQNAFNVQTMNTLNSAVPLNGYVVDMTPQLRRNI
jgi:hypothetical protein